MLVPSQFRKREPHLRLLDCLGADGRHYASRQSGEDRRHCGVRAIRGGGGAHSWHLGRLNHYRATFEPSA
eukprot:2618570-Pyramimonas_sp.AAC.1